MAPSTAAGTVMVTRVVPPVAPARCVVREHLLEPLRVAVEDPRVALVLVSAAAGAGKTTLLSALADEFGDRRDQDVAWLQVETVDRDPSRFWAGVAAIDRVRPGIADVVAGAARATGGAGEATVPVLVNLLDAGSPLLIVLDDLHLRFTVTIAAVCSTGTVRISRRTRMLGQSAPEGATNLVNFLSAVTRRRETLQHQARISGSGAGVAMPSSSVCRTS